MISLRSMTLPLFALVAVLAGCSAESGTSAGAESVDGIQQTAAADQTEAPARSHDGNRGHHGQVRPGGPDFLVSAALRAPINLTAEQKATIEGLKTSSRPAKPAFDSGRAAKLAAAIRSNSVDSAQKPQLDESAHKARIEASAKTLATLHDTLTAEQRTALVDSIEKRAAEHRSKAKGEHRGMRGAKQDGEEHGPRMGRGPGGFGGGPMHMLADLNLTQEQKDAIKTKLSAERPAAPTAEQREAMKAKLESMRTEMKAKLESFKSDKFDSVAFVTPPARAARPEMKGHTNPLSVITSVLTPEQRETLAARIEKGPAAHVKPARLDSAK